MARIRASALVPFAFAIVSFALTLVFVVAGREPGVLEKDFILSVNATRVGQDVIKFERANAASSSSPTASATPTSSSNPLDVLNPFSPNNPLNPNNPDNPLSPIFGNLTDSINDGLEDAINGIVEGIVDSANIKNFYYLFLQKICSGNVANGTGGNADGIDVQKCESYEDASDGLQSLVGNIQSSITIANTKISVPLISQLTGSLGGLSNTLSTLRKFVLACFIISLIGSALSAVLSLPAVFFKKSRILVYMNMFWPLLASIFAFLGAILLSIAIVAITQIAGGFGSALSLFFEQGRRALLFVWLGWLFVSVAGAYWVAVWFVEVRTWRIVAKRREEGQRGNWGGVLGRFGRGREKVGQ